MPLSLRPYQIDGAKWLANGPRVRLLADDMGIGKTATAIGGCDLIRADNIIVICPAVMRPTWRREFLRFSIQERPITVLSDEHNNRIPDKGVVICSFEFASKVSNALMLAHRQTDALVIDESHNLKERDSLRTKAIFGDHCDGKGGIAEHVGRVWLLSGTPMPNHAGELYPVLRLAGEWNAGYWPFLNTFTRYQIGRHNNIIVLDHINKPELKQLLSHIMLRRLRTQVQLDLPPLTISDLPLDPKEINPSYPILDELRMYEPFFAKQMEKAFATGDWELPDVKHIASIRRLIGLAKVRNAVAYIKNELEADPDEKILVFCIHREVLKYAQAFMGGHTRILYGGTPEDKRQRYIDSFQTNSKQRVMLCQIKTAGTGLTLTAANRVIILEPSWVPADNFQAIMRAYRIGQTRPVRAEFVGLAGSIDERVSAVLRGKAIDISAILD